METKAQSAFDVVNETDAAAISEATLFGTDTGSKPEEKPAESKQEGDGELEFEETQEF